MAPEKNAPVIRLDQVCWERKSNLILQDISLTLPSQSVVALVGPNGAGKSTLLYLIAGLIRPTSGTIEVLGVPAHKLAQKRHGTVGLITPTPGLYPLLTGTENLRFFATLFDIDEEESNLRATPFLEALQLKSEMDRRVSEWSTGMQQKLSLVRALITQPRVLLLDEPTANLDPLATQAIHATIRKVANEGMTVVIATHDLHNAELVCDRAILLSKSILEEIPLASDKPQPPASKLVQSYSHHFEP